MPSVGTGATFVPGTVQNGTAGLAYLYKDGAQYATIAAGHVTFTVIGSYFVRQYDSTNTVFSDSSTIVISAPSSLGNLALSGTLTNLTASSGTITGATAGSTITSNVTGLTINSAARTYTFDGTATASTVSNGLVETLSGASNSPKSNSVTVIAATLGNLSLTNVLTNSVSSSGSITGATAGSTLVGNVTGFSVNSGARSYTFDGTASAGTVSNGLVETLAGAIGSPKNNALTVLSVAGLTAPVLTQTSVAGSNPITFTTAIASDTYIGFYVHFQRATNSGFTTGMVEDTIQITSDEFDSLAFVTSILDSMPNGATYVRARIEVDGDAIGPSAWSNILFDTLSGLPTVTLDASSASPYGTLSAGNLNWVGNGSVGAYQSVKATNSKTAVNGTEAYYELTYTLSTGNSYIGFSDATMGTSGSSDFHVPGGDVPGFSYDSGGSRNASGGSTAAIAWSNGDKIMCLMRYTSGSWKAWWGRNGTWAAECGDPTSGGAGLATSMTTALFAVVGDTRDSNLLVAFRAASQTYRGSLTPYGA